MMKEKFCLIFGAIVFILGVISSFLGLFSIAVLLFAIGLIFIFKGLIKNRIIFWILTSLIIIFLVLVVMWCTFSEIENITESQTIEYVIEKV